VARPGAVACAHIITPGTPLEPPEYCGDDADWMTERCTTHQQQDTSDTDFEAWREYQRL